MTITPPLRPVGKIVRLQIQRTALKRGEKPNRFFDPAPLLAVDRLTITADGAIARLADGSAVLDVHHAAHPESRNNRGTNLRTNDLSVGFTAHYALMRQRYGAHLFDGCAGENILVESGASLALGDVAGGIVIRPAVGPDLLWLREVRIALPCREFSAYALGAPDPEGIKAALQFLDGGLRGFCCGFDEPAPAVIALGDEVFAAA